MKETIQFIIFCLLILMLGVWIGRISHNDLIAIKVNNEIFYCQTIEITQNTNNSNQYFLYARHLQPLYNEFFDSIPFAINGDNNIIIYKNPKYLKYVENEVQEVQ